MEGSDTVHKRGGKLARPKSGGPNLFEEVRICAEYSAAPICRVRVWVKLESAGLRLSRTAILRCSTR